MATKEAINIQCIEYIDHIEERIHELTGLDLTPMPRNHKDADILRMQQLQAIASWVDRIQPVEDETLAQARKLVTSSQWSKSQIASLLIGDDDGDSNE